MSESGLTRQDLTGTAAAILCGAAWGSTNIVTKLAFRSGLTLGTFLGIRTAISCLVLWSLRLAFLPRHRVPRRLAGLLLLLGAVVFAAQSLLFNEALKRIPASVAVFGLYTYPAMVALIAWALGRERLGARKAAALAVSLLGIALVLLVSVNGVQPAGIFFALASAVLWALFTVASQGMSRRVNPLAFTTLVFTGASVTFLCGGFLTGSISAPSGPQWGWLLLNATLPVIALGAFVVAMARVGATRAAIGNMFDPPTTATLGALVLGERLTPTQVLGVVLVVAALATLPFTESPLRRPAPATGPG